jgi:nickel transport protein
MLKRIGFFVVFILLLSNLAFSHDLLIKKSDDKFKIFYGHVDDADLFEPSQVKSITGFDSTGRSIEIDIKKDKKNVFFLPPKNVVTLTVVFYDRYWVKTTKDWLHTPKRQVGKEHTILKAYKSFLFSKHLMHPSDGYSKPTNIKLEIIPLKDPFRMNIGDTLPIKVLHDGNPVNGLPISLGGSHGEKSVKCEPTNQEGVTNIIIPRKGNHVISTYHKIPLEGDPDADTLYMGTWLSFELI